MRRLLVAFILVFALTAITAQDSASRKSDASQQTSERFDLICHPFQDLEREQTIDTTYPSHSGNVADQGSPHGQQDDVKNNFCAATPFAEITHDDLVQLQMAVENDVPEYRRWNRLNLPADWSVFRGAGLKFREGMAVEYTGYLLESHNADTRGGESVNCNISGVEANDIHIAMVNTPDASECESMTAEITPHFRPTAWTPDNLNAHKGHLLQLFGHLMFDGAHKPCRNGNANRGDPARISDWEIHPVYQVEVCAKEASGAYRVWQPLN